MMATLRSRSVATLIAVGILAGCAGEPAAPTPPPAPPASRLTEVLAGRVTSEAMLAHLKELQRIADANGRARPAGSPGAAGTIDYVAKALRDKGFDVQTPEFDRLDTVSQGNPKITVAGRSFPVVQASILVTTPLAGLTGPLVRPAIPAGCAAGDYRNPLPKGAIAVVDDTACSAVDKQNAAVAKGAVGVLIVSGAKNGAPRGLFGHGYYNGLTVPVAVITPEADAALRKSNAPVQLRLDGKTVKVTSHNVIAQTKTGNQHNVVMVGAHLDSAPGSPGINSNGTGVAAVLQIALEMGPSPAVANAVRVAFWGGDQATTQGAMHYVFGLERDPLNDIALYLDVDTIGSRNAGFFTYDGDQSGTPGKDFAPDDIPVGSAGVDRMLSGYLNLAGKRPADIQLTTAMDISSFLAAGVPIGGVTTGGTQQKTPAQVRLWGGSAGQPFDPNYRTAKDSLDNVDPAALGAVASAVAETIAAYAESTDGVNGVPAPNQRHRAPVRP
jgi:Zn-dependent M28 family amino/carboxypeptidase